MVFKEIYSRQFLLNMYEDDSIIRGYSWQITEALNVLKRKDRYLPSSLLDKYEAYIAKLLEEERKANAAEIQKNKHVIINPEDTAERREEVQSQVTEEVQSDDELWSIIN